MKNTLIRILTCICLLLAFAAPAAEVSYSASTSNTNWITDYNITLQYPGFNPTLGTLTTVTLNLTAVYDTSYLFINNSTNSNGSLRSVTDAYLYLNTSGSPLLNPDPLTDFHLSVNSGTVHYGGQYTTSSHQTFGATNDYTDSGILNYFLSPTPVSLAASTETWTSSSISGNSYLQQSTTVELEGSIQYTYTPVPEPATFALAGMGALAIIWLKHKK